MEMAMKIQWDKIQAVIFDLDGTLVDSMWMWEQIDIEYLGRYGISLPDRLPKDIEGMSFSETALYFKETFCLPDSPDAIKAEWNQMAYEKYLREITLKPSARRFLEVMKHRHIPMGIATSNSRELATAALQGLQITGFFQNVTTACEVAAGKPSPEIYQRVAEVLQVPAEKCLAFEDVPAGILAGKGAGMAVVAVHDEFSLHMENEKRLMADGYIYDYSEILTEWR